MKNKICIITFVFGQMISVAQTTQQMNSTPMKTAFYSAYGVLKNMLEGKDSLNYEKAVFVTENAYCENIYKYSDFKQEIDNNSKLIKIIAGNARQENQKKYKSLKIHEQKMFNLNATNWAIFKYLTGTTMILVGDSIYYKKPYTYSTQDPYGSNQWENTQVMNLLSGNNMKGNCYALSALFKIFSDRLNSDARLAIAPHHIYIQNRNQKGDFKNVELTTKTFPGDGSIQTLTYTTHELIMNGMSQRMLSNKDAIALNLIYLAKGFEHKFNDNTNDFLLECAELAFKHDSLSLNALLLKAEVTENRLFAAMKKNKVITVSQTKANVHTQKILLSYEKQLNNLYKIGYREIPKDIEHILLSAMQGNKDGYITTDKTPNPFAPIGQKQRYATLSWGVFDEIHVDADTTNYFHALLNTKSKKIIEFLPFDTIGGYKVDPVVFASSVDPLAQKFPSWSPYVAFADNPIVYVDKDGREVIKSDAFKASLNREAAYQTFLVTTSAKNLLNKFASTNTGDYTASTAGALSGHNLQFDTQVGKNLGLTTMKVEINGKFEEYNPKKHAGLVNQSTKFEIQINLSNEKNAGAGAAILNHEAFIFAEEYGNALEAYQNGKMSTEAFTETLKGLNGETGIEKAYMKVLDPKSTYTAAQKELIQTLKTDNRTKDASSAQSVYDTDVEQIEADYPDREK